MPPEDGRSVSYIFKAFLTVAFSFLVASAVSLAGATLQSGGTNSRAEVAATAETAGAVTDKEVDKSTNTKVGASKSGTPTTKETSPCDSAGKVESKERQKCVAEKAPGVVTWEGVNAGSC